MTIEQTKEVINKSLDLLDCLIKTDFHDKMLTTLGFTTITEIRDLLLHIKNERSEIWTQLNHETDRMCKTYILLIKKLCDLKEMSSEEYIDLSSSLGEIFTKEQLRNFK